MGDATGALIEPIREASRRLVRKLGFMRDGLAGVSLPASAVHALLEIDAREGITAAELSGLLDLEKSSVSRMLRKLVEAGEIVEGAAGPDGRSKPLSLTTRGHATTAAIHAFARRQVAEALGRLEPDQQETATKGLRLYADALMAQSADREPRGIVIKEGYRAGALGCCVGMHARYYAREAGFGASFEAIVAAGLAEFSARLDRPGNGLWLAMREHRIVGTVAVDGEDMGPGVAHLRWFIVDDGARGGGAGRKLLSAAVAFCEARGFEAIQLWTFQGLHAARHLYESEGFRLVEERPGRQWGREVLEQRFARRVARPA